MEKILPVAQKMLTLILYVLVQGATRGGDWAIQNYIIYKYDSWVAFLPAVALGAAFNVSFGYILQKMLVFPPGPLTITPAIPNRFGTFVVLRGVFGVSAFVLLSILYILWPEPYWIYSAVITLTMWLLTYQSQRDVFTGRLRQLPRVVRHTRVTMFQFPKKSKQFLR